MENQIARRQMWWIILAMGAALSMVFVDQTAVPIALPQIQKHLNTSNQNLQWVINAYQLALAAFVIIGGKLSDLYGQRRIFSIGLVCFTLASLSCTFAQSIYDLIASRALQGIGGALMIPTTGVIVLNSIPQQERGRIMGIYVGSAAAFIVLGPLLGGFVTQYLSWRFVFFLNFPIALCAFCITQMKVPRYIILPHKEKIDWYGFSSLAMAMFMLIFAIMQSPGLGLSSPIILSCVAIFVGATLLFIRIEKRTNAPLVDLNAFKCKSYLYAVLCLLVTQVQFMASIFWAIFMQNILDYSPSVAGLLTLPYVLPTLISPRIGGIMYDRYGPRKPVLIGFLGMCFSTLWVGFFAFQYNYLWLLPGLFVFGCSSPLCISASMTTALSSLEKEQHGMASGIANAARQLGSAIGLALCTSIISVIYNHDLHSALLNLGSTFKSIEIDKIHGILKNAKPALNYLNTYSAAEISTIKAFAKQAYTLGFSSAMFTLAIVAAIGFFFALRLPKKPTGSTDIYTQTT